MTARVYGCGPITGLSYEQARFGWRKQFADLLDPRIEFLSPMRQEGHLAEVTEIAHQAYAGSAMSSIRGIVAKDKLDVQRSTIIVANFLGAKNVSIGSVIELGWANAWDKPIILVMEPKDNIHDRFFLTELSHFRTDSVEEAAHWSNALILPGV